MDGGLGIRWPLSPFAAIAALGAALLSICFAIWSKEDTPEEDQEASEEVPVRQAPSANLEQSQRSLLNSDKSAPVIRVRDLELRWGEATSHSRLLYPTVHSSFLDIRDESTLRGADFWNRSIGERGGDNELESGQESLDVIRQKFVPPVRDTSGFHLRSESVGQRESAEFRSSSSRILESYFRHSVLSKQRGLRHRLANTRPFNRDFHPLREFASSPDVFNVTSKHPLFISHLDFKAESGERTHHDWKGHLGDREEEVQKQTHKKTTMEEENFRDVKISDRDKISCENVQVKRFEMKTRSGDSTVIGSEPIHDHPSSIVSHYGGVGDFDQHSKSDSSIYRYESVDDALINGNNSADIDIECASSSIERNHLTEASIGNSDFTTAEHLERSGGGGASIAIAGESSPSVDDGSGRREIVVRQVDHLAHGGFESVTAVKGSVEGDTDVTREGSRDGTIWGVAAADTTVVVERSMDEEADALDAIVRDLRGICEGLHISNGNGSVGKIGKSSFPKKKSVVEVSSVSECLFRQDNRGSETFESILSLETVSDNLSSVHRVTSVLRDSNGGDVRLSHRIESETTTGSVNSATDAEKLCRLSSSVGNGHSPSVPDKVVSGECKSPVKRAETPPLSRLMVLLDRDEERRARSKYIAEVVGDSDNCVEDIASNGHSSTATTREHPGKLLNGSSPPSESPTLGASATPAAAAEGETASERSKPRGEGEWDALMRDVLASVSELERFEEEQEKVVGWRSERRDERTRRFPIQPLAHSVTSDHAMEATPSEAKVAITPTKVKNLRFKLDPDVFDVPSDDSFYDDDDTDRRSKPKWRGRTKYQTFSALELGKDDPVQLVSVRTSVVPPGHKMVVRPAASTDEARMRLKQLDIDLHIRLEGEDPKRGHHSPAQVKRKSPVTERTGWCQELSPVSENVDWREAWSSLPSDVNGSPKVEVAKPIVPNGILKTSPKTEIAVDKSNPFKSDNQQIVSPTKPVTENGVTSPVKSASTQNGMTPRKLFIPRKKFVPDPEAIERITGYKLALAKPPLPPPPTNRTSPRLGGTAKKRADCARKQYFDHKAALAASKAQESSQQKFQQFLVQAQNDRARLVTSTPDLGAIEQAVMTQWLKDKAASQNKTSSERLDSRESTPSRSTTPDDVWSGYVQMCRRHLNRRSRSLCYLETDIDAIMVEDDKALSLTTLNEPESLPSRLEPKDFFDESVEDLADSGHAKSEHEVRIEKSLKNLSLPDWYRNCEKPKSGFLLGSSNAKEKKGWAAAKSLASSTSSLTSCGVRRSRPIRSLRSSQENIPWSRGSVSPAETDHGLGRNGPSLSLALARAFREPYLGWRARTPSSGVSSSPQVDLSPPSWVADSCDTPLTSDLPPMDEEGVSFDGEDVILVNSSSEPQTREEDGDTCEDVVTMSMDTCDGHKDLPGEDTCDDINNMSMDTCELFPPPTNGEQKSSPLAGDDTCDDVRNISSDTAGLNGHPSPLNTGDDINNLSTDASESQDDSSLRNGDSSSMYQKSVSSSKRSDMKRKRYSYSQSIYHSEWDDDAEGMKDSSSTRESSPANKIIWIESSFVGSRTTTSIVVLPTQKDDLEHTSNGIVRPASR